MNHEPHDDERVNLPIVDFLAHEPELCSYVAEFVPERKVSGEQKEGLSVADDTPTGRRLGELLSELATVCGTAARVVKLGHGGGDRFTLHTADGGYLELDGSDRSPLDAYPVLQLMAEELQYEFLLQRRRPSRIAG